MISNQKREPPLGLGEIQDAEMADRVSGAQLQPGGQEHFPGTPFVRLRILNNAGDEVGVNLCPITEIDKTSPLLDGTLNSPVSTTPSKTIRNVSPEAVARYIQCIYPAHLNTLPPGDISLIESPNEPGKRVLGLRPIVWSFRQEAELYIVARKLNNATVCNMLFNRWRSRAQHMDTRPELPEQDQAGVSDPIFNGLVEKLTEQVCDPNKPTIDILEFDPHDMIKLWLSVAEDDPVRQFWADIFNDQADVYKVKVVEMQSNWLDAWRNMVNHKVDETNGFDIYHADDDAFCARYHTDCAAGACSMKDLSKPVFNQGYIAATQARLVRLEALIDDNDRRKYRTEVEHHSRWLHSDADPFRPDNHGARGGSRRARSAAQLMKKARGVIEKNKLSDKHQ